MKNKLNIINNKETLHFFIEVLSWIIKQKSQNCLIRKFLKRTPINSKLNEIK